MSDGIESDLMTSHPAAATMADWRNCGRQADDGTTLDDWNEMKPDSDRQPSLAMLDEYTTQTSNPNQRGRSRRTGRYFPQPQRTLTMTRVNRIIVIVNYQGCECN